MLDKESRVFHKPYPTRQDWETAVERINEIANAYIKKNERTTFDDSAIEIYTYFIMDDVNVGLYGFFKDSQIHEIITQYGVGVRYEEATRLYELIENKLKNFAKYSARNYPVKNDNSDDDHTTTCYHCADDNRCFFHYLCNSLYKNSSPQIAIEKIRDEEAFGPKRRVFTDIYAHIRQMTGTEDKANHESYIFELLTADDTDSELLKLGKKLRIKGAGKIKKWLKEYLSQPQETTIGNSIEAIASDEKGASLEEIYIKQEETSDTTKDLKQIVFQEFFNRIGTNDDGRCVLGTYVVTEELVLAGLESWKIRDSSTQYFSEHLKNPKVAYTVINFAEIKDVLKNNASADLSGIVQGKCPCCDNESIDCEPNCDARCDVECSHVEIACEVTESYYRDIACWMFSLHRQPSLNKALPRYAKECGYNVISPLDYRIIKSLRNALPKTQTVLES